MTKIEWVKNPDNTTQGITVNSKTGCKNHTPEGLCLGGLFPCYAYKLAHGRLRERYLTNTNLVDGAKGGVSKVSNAYQVLATKREGDYSDPFYPRWWPEHLDKIRRIKKPTGIFLDDMSDWMGDYWPEEWTMAELQMMRDNPQHRIYTLTKQPQNLIKFSPFPDNCYVGVTATSDLHYVKAFALLSLIEAKVKYISLEPLLGRISDTGAFMKSASINWLIPGACTGTLPEMVSLCDKYPKLAIMRCGNKLTAQPHIEDLREIVEAADKAGVPVFLKNNLRPLLIPDDCTKPNCLMDDIFWSSEKAQLRQEMPKETIALVQDAIEVPSVPLWLRYTSLKNLWREL